MFSVILSCSDFISLGLYLRVSSIWNYRLSSGRRCQWTVGAINLSRLRGYAWQLGICAVLANRESGSFPPLVLLIITGADLIMFGVWPVLCGTYTEWLLPTRAGILPPYTKQVRPLLLVMISAPKPCHSSPGPWENTTKIHFAEVLRVPGPQQEMRCENLRSQPMCFFNGQTTPVYNP